MTFNVLKCPVFTYWEGEKHPFTDLCISSISYIFGNRHIHLDKDNLNDWIDIPTNILSSVHLIFRSDYIRTKLLEKYGGWWFDCDVLLYKNPSNLVQGDKPSIWNLIYYWEDKWQPMINCGILFSPPKSEWISKISHDFDKVNLSNFFEITLENEDIGQKIYEKYCEDTVDVIIGHEHVFNSTVNVNADYKPFVDGTIKLSSAQYGLHIGASLARWAAHNGDPSAKLLLESKTIEEIIKYFPLSVISQYCSRYLKMC